jgi:uncharacterized protein with PIN domain
MNNGSLNPDHDVGSDPTDSADATVSAELESTTHDTTFLCDVMCGSLVTYLRMCGYDAAYALDRGVEADDRLLELARDERRVLLTCDRELARRARTDAETAENDVRANGLLLESREVSGQLRELRDTGYDLALAERPARCGRCNGPVEAIGGEEPTPEYAPDAGTEAVWRCVECDQHFWKGSHWESVERTLADL